MSKTEKIDANEVLEYAYICMQNVSVDVRLRPIRFGFLVRPQDKVRVQKIIEINTCLWGGRFNPIIPFIKRVPTWWDREGFKFDNAKQIINGYIDFFEPDFLVEAEKGLATGLGFDAARVLQLSDLLPREGESNFKGTGQNVFDLYKHLYQEEYQFVRRHPQSFILPRGKDKSTALYVAALFGAFPREKRLAYFLRGYKKAFDCKTAHVDAGVFLKLQQKGFVSPLAVTESKLEVDFPYQHSPVLFVMRGDQASDVIDFWNYRAIHRDILAIPFEWLADLSGFCKKLIVKQHRPLPGNRNGVMITMTVMFARSLSKSQISEAYPKFLQTEVNEANIVQTWYPPFWRPAPSIMVRTTRPIINAGNKKHEIPFNFEKSHISFENISPEFAAKYANKNRWTNVIFLNDWYHGENIATVFPCEVRRAVVPQYGFGDERPISTAEGLVAFSQFKNHSYLWRLTDGAEAFAQWFKDKGIEATPSDAGRATQQMIEAMGSFWGFSTIAHKGIIELLDSMARRPVTKTAHRGEFQQRVNAAVDPKALPSNTFERLVEQKVVDLGYELKCPRCGSWTWFALNQLDSSLECDLCRRQFPFPTANPNSGKTGRWAYRVVGPFALPSYAKGAYAAALTIRFFTNIVGRSHHAQVTWSGGQDLKFLSGNKMEMDILLWYQRKAHQQVHYPTDVVFGEAKSFGRECFEDEDFDRMKKLAVIYPCSVIVFATMKEASELSKKELKKLRSFAKWGREFDHERRKSKAAMILLTGTELFSSFSLDATWREKGGKHAKFIEPAYIHLDSLRTLANLTQQIYLDMPSYDARRHPRSILK